MLLQLQLLLVLPASAGLRPTRPCRLHPAELLLESLLLDCGLPQPLPSNELLVPSGHQGLLQ
jgi:hypothetical protein